MVTSAEQYKQSLLYKYLDIDGAKAMLKNSNLQFTKANKLNDPFDCHPGLVCNSKDFPNIPVEELVKMMNAGIKIGEFGYTPSLNRDYTYVCSLSKIFKSILMWSYYTKDHKGVCIGIDMPKLNQYLYLIYFCVEYPENLTKYNWAAGTSMEAFKHQLATKAPEWKHENEVRLLLPLKFPPCEDHYQRIRINGDCFNSIYLGVNIEKKEKNEIIRLVGELNPYIKIYQMKVDPDAFRLSYSEENI